MQINLIGGAYQHAAISTNNQRCLNAYPVVPGKDGRGVATLLPRAGKYELTTLINDPEVRGMLAVNNTVYVAAGDKLWKMTVDDVARTVSGVTSLGTINGFNDPVYMAANATQVIVVDGTTHGYIYSPRTYARITVGPIGGVALDTYTLTIQGTAVYTAAAVSTALTVAALIAQINTVTGTTGVTAASGGTGVITLTAADDTSIVVAESGTGFTAGTDGLTVTGQALSTGTATAFRTITDTDFLGGSSVVFLDGYFFLSVPGTNRFYASNLNDGLTYNGLDIATAEINQSPIVALAVKNRQLWIFKENYIEVWYDAANPTGMPLSPRVGSELSIGTIAPNSVVNIDNTLYWLDNRGFIVSAINSGTITNNTTGNTAQPVSTDALNTTFSLYDDISDAISTGFVERGHLMYQINFPTAGYSWVFDLTTGEWHERSLLDQALSTHQPDTTMFSVQVGLLTIVSGAETSGTIYISHIDYKDDDGIPIQAIRTTPHLSQDFKLFGIDSLTLKCLTGTANSSGDGSDPHIILRYSTDSGRSWSSDLTESLGLTGDYVTQVSWGRLGTAFEWLFEFTIVAPIDWAITDASIVPSELEQY